VFRGFSRVASKNGKAAFRVVWHRGRPFDIAVDSAKGTIHCPIVLPQVPARSALYRQLRSFLEACQNPSLPEHRRVDRRKVQVACANRGGNVSLTMTIRGSHHEYGARKFIHLIQEIYLVFLTEHFDYQVEAFDLDPDRP